MKTTAITTTPIQELFSARQKIYQFLYLLFSAQLTENRLKELRDLGGLDELAMLDEGGAQISGFLLTCTPVQMREEQEEFFRLFIGPDSIKAPPWESYYRSKEGILFGESTFEVRKAYRQLGLSYINENRYPDDHLLLELEFMLFLLNATERETDLKKMFDLIEKQLDFIELHLAIWIPKFCDRITSSTESKLYNGAALLLKDFITFEIDLLRELKEEFGNG
jgi:TorA maturation chaperone TorD